jgi:hypothetical protein
MAGQPRAVPWVHPGRNEHPGMPAKSPSGSPGLGSERESKPGAASCAVGVPSRLAGSSPPCPARCGGRCNRHRPSAASPHHRARKPYQGRQEHPGQRPPGVGGSHQARRSFRGRAPPGGACKPERAHRLAQGLVRGAGRGKPGHRRPGVPPPGGTHRRFLCRSRGEVPCPRSQAPARRPDSGPGPTPEFHR